MFKKDLRSFSNAQTKKKGYKQWTSCRILCSTYWPRPVSPRTAAGILEPSTKTRGEMLMVDGSTSSVGRTLATRPANEHIRKFSGYVRKTWLKNRAITAVRTQTSSNVWLNTKTAWIYCPANQGMSGSKSQLVKSCKQDLKPRCQNDPKWANLVPSLRFLVPKVKSWASWASWASTTSCKERVIRISCFLSMTLLVAEWSIYKCLYIKSI